MTEGMRHMSDGFAFKDGVWVAIHPESNEESVFWETREKSEPLGEKRRIKRLAFSLLLRSEAQQGWVEYSLSSESRCLTRPRLSSR